MTRIPKKTYTPIGCLVALHLYPPDETPAGLVVPTREGMSQYEATRCRVIAVGPECKWVKEGDEVLCTNPAQGIIHKGNTTALVREEHLAGIVIPEVH